MARLEVRVASLEQAGGGELRSLSDAELERRLMGLVTVAIGRTPSHAELPALVASLREKPPETWPKG